ncbi:MAG: nascent polypeptide-associated complex protein [Candidatus Woesearchaeota archaeon]
MLPGMNMNSKQMRSAMKKMGVQQEELDASRVIIDLGDRRLVFDSPQVSKVNMMGSQTYQVVGEPHEEKVDNSPDISDEDITMVAEQAEVSEEKAKSAIEASGGDLAEAIMELQKEKDAESQ